MSEKFVDAPDDRALRLAAKAASRHLAASLPRGVKFVLLLGTTDDAECTTTHSNFDARMLLAEALKRFGATHGKTAVYRGGVWKFLCKNGHRWSLALDGELSSQTACADCDMVGDIKAMSPQRAQSGHRDTGRRK